MRAVRFSEYGDLDVLRVDEVPAPEPGEGEVTIRVQAAGVNPIDWKILHGTYASEPLTEPRGLGVELAGVLEHVGAGVEGLVEGEEVLGAAASPAYAEIALARAHALLRRPPDVPWEVAGSLAVVVGTAYATLERLDLQPGETLLLLGASGGVGSVATQLAVARGVEVLGTAGESKLERLRALGARGVLYGNGLEQRLREAAPGGVDAVLDASGHGELPAAIALAGGTGRALTIAGSPAANELGVPFHAGGGGELTQQALREVLPLIQSGRFDFPIAGLFDLGQVPDALRESEHGHPTGKLVVVPA